MNEASKPVLDPRVALAAERTLLAWIRTGVALMGFGFLVSRFSGGAALASISGTTAGAALIVLGMLVNVWASARHRRIIHRLEQGETAIGVQGPVMVGMATVVGGMLLIAVLLVGAA